MTVYASAVRALERSVLEIHPRYQPGAEALPGFSTPERYRFEALAQETAGRCDALSEGDERGFLRLVLPLVSALGDEHTRIPFHRMDAYSGLALDTPLNVDESGLSLVESGARVLAVNGVDAGALLDELAGYLSGVSKESRLTRLHMLLAAALRLRFGDAPLILETAAGAVRVSIVRAEPEKTVSCAVEGCRLKLRITRFEGDKRTFAGAAEAALLEGKRRGCHTLEIDLRDNDGGATALADALLKRLIKGPFQELLSSQIRVSDEARAYFSSFLPAFLVKSGLARRIPVYGAIFRAPRDGVAEIPMPKVRGKGDLTFEETLVRVNGASISTCALLADTVLFCNAGRVEGRCGGYATHYGNQLPLTLEGTSIPLEIPCSVNYGHSAGPIHAASPES